MHPALNNICEGREVLGPGSSQMNGCHAGCPPEPPAEVAAQLCLCTAGVVICGAGVGLNEPWRSLPAQDILFLYLLLCTPGTTQHPGMHSRGGLCCFSQSCCATSGRDAVTFGIQTTVLCPVSAGRLSWQEGLSWAPSMAGGTGTRTVPGPPWSEQSLATPWRVWAQPLPPRGATH